MKKNNLKNQQIRQVNGLLEANKLSTKVILGGIVLVTLLSLSTIYMLSKHNKRKNIPQNAVIVNNVENIKTPLDVNFINNVDGKRIHSPLFYLNNSDKKFVSIFDLRLQQFTAISDKSDKTTSWCINGKSVKDINEKCSIPSKIEMDRDNKLSDDFFNYLKLIDKQTQFVNVNKNTTQPKVLAKNIYLFLNIRDNPNKYQSKDEFVDNIYKNIQNQPIVTIEQANNYIESLKTALSTNKNMNTNMTISNSTYNPPPVYNNNPYPMQNNMEQFAQQNNNIQDSNAEYNQEEIIESEPSLVMTKTRKVTDN